jgi:hypothetical protein
MFSVEIEENPVDATNAKIVADFRTMFLSFHHMPPPVAQGIINDAIRTGQGIAICELMIRTVPYALFSAITFPLVPLLTFHRYPFSVLRFIFTFIFPVIPFVFAFDGCVSTLRTYSDDDIKAMIKKSPNSESFEWSVGCKWIGLVPLRYCIGYPKQKINRSD